MKPDTGKLVQCECGRSGSAVPAILAALVVLFFLVPTGFGQPVDLKLEFGVRAGAPLLQPLLVPNLSGLSAAFTRWEIGNSSYTVGPTVGLILADRFGVEFEALYRPLGFETRTAGTPNPSSSTVDGGVWEFPISGRYRFLSGTFRPFAGAGAVLGTRVRGTSESLRTDFPSLVQTVTYETYDRIEGRQRSAWLIQGGVEIRRSNLTLRPEVRYTRRGPPHQRSLVARRSEELMILFGISFVVP